MTKLIKSFKQIIRPKAKEMFSYRRTSKVFTALKHLLVTTFYVAYYVYGISVKLGC